MNAYTLPKDLIDDLRMPSAWQKADAIASKIGPVTAPQLARIAVDMFYEPSSGSYSVEKMSGHLFISRGFHGTTGSAEIDKAGHIVEKW